MQLKSTLSKVGNGLLDAASALHNASIDSKIEALDEQIAKLQEERTELEQQRI